MGNAATTPLTRYLIHAAKLRYEYRVWEESRISVGAQRNQVSETSAAVLGQLRSADRGLPLDTDTVSKLLKPCYALEADLAELVDMGSQIQQLKRTVEIAAQTSPSRSSCRLRGAGRRCYRRSEARDMAGPQLDDDATYLIAVREEARDVVAAARDALERRSAALDQVEHERRDKVSLLQAVVISAAVLCLTAVQALGYKVPLAGGVQAPAVAALSACTLWLVLVVITWLSASPCTHRERAAVAS